MSENPHVYKILTNFPVPIQSVWQCDHHGEEKWSEVKWSEVNFLFQIWESRALWYTLILLHEVRELFKKTY